MRNHRLSSAAVAILAGLSAAWGPASQPAELTGLARIRADAAAARSLVRSDLGRAFLSAVDALPAIAERPIYHNPKTRRILSPGSYEKADAAARAGFERDTINEENYYFTKYGTPVAYARAIDLLGQNGLSTLRGARLLDFGYGGIGHLRMLATLGCDAVGVDVDPFLHELYSEPQDQGAVSNRAGASGRVTVLDGHWPGDAAIRRAAGKEFDIIVSKNTLKNGYIHPAEKVDKRMTIDLGASDEEFVRAVYESLRPGGWFLIYNVCPGPNQPGKPYIPWADGRCPFARADLEKQGFRVVKFDESDTSTIHQFGHAFGWDAGERP
ncbi:MAG: hypothetical protein U1A27_15035, partial [Phycisphaerae bacterium]